MAVYFSNGNCPFAVQVKNVRPKIVNRVFINIGGNYVIGAIFASFNYL
jgi:hypothetical protein